MRQGQQNNKRMRGRGRKGPNPLTRSYESNGPDVKVRGTPLHIAERYTQLARDAQAAGDRVQGENLLQHAEHYYRIVAAAQAQQNQAQGQGQPQPHGRDDGDGNNAGEDGLAGNGDDRRQANQDDTDQPVAGATDQPRMNGNGQATAAVDGDGEQPEDGRDDGQEAAAPRPRRRRPYRARAENQGDPVAASPIAPETGAVAEATPVED
ncbi:MAG: DUF4167 domain-containing protein [Bauldia sp.]|uniref:DUF4167 domain-containing protein n=1 Tax=Bauldia sp. TaxID=2575872 RepID=UPI001D68788F|nr:DUF4167 domain-containing protein [Bauldia sp.]MCB1494150.1 DUF4167 domain-containing protein [Bauldia sp.]